MCVEGGVLSHTISSFLCVKEKSSFILLLSPQFSSFSWNESIDSFFMYNSFVIVMI